MRVLRDLFQTLKETGNDWLDDNASRLAAALAYYTLLSLAPLLVILIGIAGFFLGPEAARGQVATELGSVVGAEAAEGIQAIIFSARSPSSGVLSTIVGVVALFIGASGVFGELQSALDTIWEVAPKPGRSIFVQVKERFLSFTMVLGVAFLLLVSLVLSAALSAVGGVFANALPGGEFVWQGVNFVFSFAMVTGLFALIFKYIPDAKVEWRDVWAGAAVTSFLFSLGKLGLGLYLGKAAVGSSYGAAGSLIVLVVWVYYAAQILFFGAEFTQVQARRRGREIQPNHNAIRINNPVAEAARQAKEAAQAAAP